MNVHCRYVEFWSSYVFDIIVMEFVFFINVQIFDKEWNVNTPFF
jgi:hypothetical protein